MLQGQVITGEQGEQVVTGEQGDRGDHLIYISSLLSELPDSSFPYSP